MNLPSNVMNLSVEAKSGVLFAAVALFFSILLGVIKGVGAGTVALRSLLLTVLFAGLGFAVTSVLKKYVPELYDLITGMNQREPDAGSAYAAPDAAVREAAEEAGSAMNPNKDETPPDPGMSPMSDEEFSKFIGEGGGESKKKMGKHIISNEKIVSYEPKILAQAVRTMMKRDED